MTKLRYICFTNHCVLCILILSTYYTFVYLLHKSIISVKHKSPKYWVSAKVLPVLLLLKESK